MKLSLRPARDITEPPVDPAVEHERQVRQARLELARRRPTWTEIPETRLVPRGPRFLIDAETDRVYTVRRGAVWDPDRASVGYVSETSP